jgi:hypothetical protein
MRKGDNPGETYAIQTSVLGVPHLASQSEFMDYIKKTQTERADPTRFNDLKRNSIPHPKKGEFCAQSYAMIEDRAAVTNPGVVESMILEIVTLSCRHPTSVNVAVEVIYSHRHHPGQSDPYLSEKAEVLFESVEFSDL